ncbi:MAG: carboxypeptidase-like regulatory domain-containing protein, partial [Polyangiaceae bacterium]
MALAGLGWLVCLLFVASLRPQPRLTPLPAELSRREPTLSVEVSGLTESGACAGQPDAGPCAARTVVPLANARLRVLVEQDGFQRELWDARADAQGRATLSVPPGNLYVLADAEGWARRSLRLEVGEADARVGLELARAEPFEVRVVSEAGMPIVEANVVVTAADELPYVALTNREGVASFARLAPPLERVAVSASGFAGIEVAPVLPSTEVLMRAPSRLEVLLQDEAGRALAGAELWIAGLSIWPPRKVTSDDDGMVRVDALEPGIYDLKAQHEGRVSRLELGLSIER